MTNGGLITDSVDKANNLNNFYASVFSFERDIPAMISTYSDKPFTIKIAIIRKRLAMIGRNKSVGHDGIPGAILKMDGGAMFPYVARLLDMMINNGTIPRDWKRDTVVPIHKGGDRSVVKNKFICIFHNVNDFPAYFAVSKPFQNFHGKAFAV
jgi:hypothetical protein